MKTILTVLMLTFVLSSCYNDKYEEIHPFAYYSNDCDTTLADTYTASVASIINNNCTSCHNTSTLSGNIDLSSYQSVVSCINGGRFLGSILQSSGYYAMPPNTKLQPCEIARLQRWIQKNMPQ